MSVRQLSEEIADTSYDICIVGSGPAGLTLCNELLGTGKRICVVESGMENTRDCDSLKKVSCTGEILIRNNSRERVFGGSSLTWGGVSAPFDTVDLEKWPIPEHEIEEQYKKLCAYGFASYETFKTAALAEIKKTSTFAPQWKQLQEKSFVAADSPWNFGSKFKSIFDNNNVDLLLDATVTNINASSNGFIQSVSLCNSSKRNIQLKAETFILCAGGLETVRLLLLSRDTFPNGIGNEYDLVGKYLMNHPKSVLGTLELNTPIKNISHLFGHLHKGFAAFVGLRIREDLQRKKHILNSYIRLEPIYPWANNRGTTAFIEITTKRARMFLNWWKKHNTQTVALQDWNEDCDDAGQEIQREHELSLTRALFYILVDLRTVLTYVNNRLRPHADVRIKKMRVRNFMEMEPRAENKMTLSTKETDIYGNPLPVVCLNTSLTDRNSLIQLHKLLEKEVDRLGLGIFVSNLASAEPWPITMDASHHLGGTIMGAHSKNSVVDTNLKIHSIKNLYICGGSVFPTSGCANPTYTICALALRLAGHLKNKVTL